MDFINLIYWIFLGATFVSVAASYARIGASVRRAMDARMRGQAWVLVHLVAFLWPVALPALAVRDLLVRDHSFPLLMSEPEYRSKILAQEGASQLHDEAAIERVYAEWQSRVNYFHKLGQEAESTQDWVLGQTVAANLEFLLETEPPRPVGLPTSKLTPKQPESKSNSLAAAQAQVEQQVKGSFGIPGAQLREPEGYCKLCAAHRKKDHFPHHKITGT